MIPKRLFVSFELLFEIEPVGILQTYPYHEMTFFFSFFEIVNYCQKWVIIILKSAVKKCVIII